MALLLTLITVTAGTLLGLIWLSRTRKAYWGSTSMAVAEAVLACFLCCSFFWATFLVADYLFAVILIFVGIMGLVIWRHKESRESDRHALFLLGVLAASLVFAFSFGVFELAMSTTTPFSDRELIAQGILHSVSPSGLLPVTASVAGAVILGVIAGSLCGRNRSSS